LILTVTLSKVLLHKTNATKTERDNNMTSPTIYLTQRIKKKVNQNSVVYHIIDDGLIQEFNTLKGAQEFVAYLDQLKTEREA